MPALKLLLASLATAMPLLALAKLRDLWRRYRFPARGKYSTIFGTGGSVVMAREE